MQSMTIIVPVYNEEGCLIKLFDALNGFVQHSDISTTVLFVDDGSTDSSLGLIESFCSTHTNFYFISLRHNSGLSAALKCGIDHVHTELIGYLDADLQTTPEDFYKLLKFIPEYDLVLGVRTNRRDGPVKRISSLTANAVRKLLLNDNIKDTGCPLKIIKTEYAKRIPFFKGMHRFLPNAVMMLGGKVMQVPVRHFPRLAGKSKYNLFNRLLGPFIDALVFRWMQRNYIRYDIKKNSLSIIQSLSREI
jgi:glycosyltransferase involved in cell wall biosynthesis